MRIKIPILIANECKTRQHIKLTTTSGHFEDFDGIVLQNDASASRTAPIILLLLPIWRPSIDLPDKVEEDLKG